MRLYLLLTWAAIASCTSGAPPSMRERRLAKRIMEIESRVSSLTPQQPTRATPADLLRLPANVDAPSYVVPHDQRAAGVGEEVLQSPVQFVGFDDILPGLGFSRLFNSNAGFRRELRAAARTDFGTTAATPRALLHDPRSSLSGRWLGTSCDYESLSGVLQRYLPPEKQLSGPAFIAALTGLCPDSPHRFGSWMDIVGVQGRPVPHSFHQDSGLAQTTVMVGFPPCDDYEGLGVFSHAVKLSHRLPPPTPEERGRPRLWDAARQGEVPAECVVRPMYREGREIMIYDDRDVFHSAPDFCSRESVWRIM